MPDIMVYTIPLSGSAQNNWTFQWTPLLDKCFQSIKVIAMWSPILKPVDFNRNEPVWVIMVTSMDANPNMYPILIPPVSNTFYFCHHPQPHHSQPYHAQSIIYHPSFIINGNSWYWAYSIPPLLIFPIFNRPPSLLRPPLNSVKWSSPQNDSCHRRYSPIWNISSTMHIF